MNKQVILSIFEKLNYKHQNYIGDNNIMKKGHRY